jgi:thiol-disulfide isomerase/thioredoxin
MKNFKTLFILICLSCFFFSFTDKDKTNRTVISGIIKTEGTPLSLKKITLEFPDYLNSTNEITVPVDSLGHFRVELNLNHPTDFSIKFRKRLMFFVSPGDSIYLNINQSILRAGSSKLAKAYSYINLTGTAQKVNNDLFHFNSCLSDSLTDWDLEENSITNLTPEQYKAFIAGKASKQETFLKEFNEQQQTCLEFQEWAKYHLRFGIWNDLFQYYGTRESAKVDKALFYKTFPQSYFDFIKDWDVNNQRAEITSNFFSFMKGFNKKIGLDCASGLNINDKNFLNDYFLCFKGKVNQIKPQYIKNILFAKFYENLLKSKNFQFLSSIYQPDLIHDKDLNSRIQRLFDTERVIVEKATLSEGSKFKIMDRKNVNNFIDTLISRCKGKVIFIDFWGPWCAPCIKELPFSKVLHEELNGKDIVFVYLAVRTNENAWQQTITQKSIEGDHYLLNKEQEIYLLDKFSFSEFPHYALIGKDGLIYKKSAFSPSQKAELMKDINYLLTKE